jgi:site-specific DNA recombinase
LKNAIIYCRVSTAEQTKNLSLTTQRTACRDYCDRLGFHVVEEFVEQGESAKTADRTQLTRLIDYCRKNKGRVSLLVVYNLSRFARERHDHVVLRALLGTFGVTLRSATEPIDDTAVGMLMEGILASFAQFDNNQKADRTKAGMAAALERGRWVWVAPLGYKNGPKGGPSLIPDDERARIIKVAFESLGSEGTPVADLLRMVTDLGLRTRSGARLTLQSFHSLLRNPIYMGRLVSPKWGIERAGDFDGLVSADVFDRAQAALSGRGARKVRHHRVNPDFPLRRFVRCGECGGPLTGSWSRGRSSRYAYYHCVRCGSVRAKAPELEREFLELLEGLKPSPGYLRLFGEVVRDAWSSKKDTSARTASLADARVRDTRQRLHVLDEAFLFRQEIDRETYVSLRDRLRQDLALAEIALQEARIEELDVEAALAASEMVLSNAAALWMTASVEQRQRLQRALFPNGLTFDGVGFGTVVTCLAFNEFRGFARATEGLASPPGFEPGSRP